MFSDVFDSFLGPSNFEYVQLHLKRLKNKHFFCLIFILINWKSIMRIYKLNILVKNEWINNKDMLVEEKKNLYKLQTKN